MASCNNVFRSRTLGKNLCSGVSHTSNDLFLSLWRFNERKINEILKMAEMAWPWLSIELSFYQLCEALMFLVIWMFLDHNVFFFFLVVVVVVVVVKKLHILHSNIFFKNAIIILFVPTNIFFFFSALNDDFWL